MEGRGFNEVQVSKTQEWTLEGRFRCFRTACHAERQLAIEPFRREGRYVGPECCLLHLPAAGGCHYPKMKRILTFPSDSLLCRIRRSRTPSTHQHPRKLDASPHRYRSCHRSRLHHLLRIPGNRTSPSQDDDQGMAAGPERDRKGEQLEPYHW